MKINAAHGFDARLTRAAASLHTGRVMIGIRKLGNGPQMSTSAPRRISGRFSGSSSEDSGVLAGVCSTL